jgi:hypothetical protein
MVVVINLGMDQPSNLLLHSSHDFRMTMSGVDNPYPRSEIEIAIAFHIINITSFPTFNREWEGSLPNRGNVLKGHVCLQKNMGLC